MKGQGDMSYHEYITKSGNTSRRHYNGLRLGASRFDPRELAEEMDPDSATWERRARITIRSLHDALDSDTWNAFCDIYNPQADGMTWRDIRDAHRKALDSLHAAIRDEYPVTADMLAFAAGLIDAPETDIPFDFESEADLHAFARVANAVKEFCND